MSDIGWVKLHRSIVDSKVFADPMVLKIWIWILSRVRFDSRTIAISVGGGTVDVPLDAGQFLFGDRSAADALGMPRTSVQRRIKRLEKLGSICVKAGRHYSIVTVTNWQTYQNSSLEDGPEVGHLRATCGPKEECKERKEQIPRAGAGRGKRSEHPPDVPAVLASSPEFMSAWEAWQTHRRELGKRLTATSAAKQLATLAEWGESRARAAIEFSITQGWQGIYEQGKPNGKHNRPESPAIVRRESFDSLPEFGTAGDATDP
jgi:hypothetical protein